jgi:hypothetical protein
MARGRAGGGFPRRHGGTPAARTRSRVADLQAQLYGVLLREGLGLRRVLRNGGGEQAILVELFLRAPASRQSDPRPGPKLAPSFVEFAPVSRHLDPNTRRGSRV